MKFERTGYDFGGEVILKTELDGKTFLIQITEEAISDNLKKAVEGDLNKWLTPDKQRKLERIIIDRISQRLFEPMTDKIGVTHDVILIKSGDLA